MLVIARALVARPRLLLVDEMSLGLAPKIVDQLATVLRRVADDLGIGVLLVEQHVPVALSIADAAVVLAHGEVVARGPAGDLAERPDLLQASYLGRERGSGRSEQAIGAPMAEDHEVGTCRRLSAPGRRREGGRTRRERQTASFRGQPAPASRRRLADGSIDSDGASAARGTAPRSTSAPARSTRGSQGASRRFPVSTRDRTSTESSRCAGASSPNATALSPFAEADVARACWANSSGRPS